MKLIIGLGNPGKQYEKTRHNIGFMVLDELARRHQITGVKSKFSAGMLQGVIAGEKCVLLQPTTFMNKSGQSVIEALNFYKLDFAKDLMIVVDEIALDVGTIRMRPGGSTNGHNGLKDIKRVLGSQAFPRLRLGVDPPGRVPQADYVLSRFSKAQADAVEPAIWRACDQLECWIENDVDTAMNRYNG